MPRRILNPLIILNAAFVVMLVTVGPSYGWLPILIAGAVVSAINILAYRLSGS